MKVERTISRDIDRCFQTCPYFSTDSELMVCEHPDAVSQYIVKHPICDNGFPEECPLLKIF